MLKPYWNPAHADVETLAPRESALPRAVASVLGRPAFPPSEAAFAPTPEDGSVPRRVCSEYEPKSHGDTSLRESARRELSPIYRPPPALLDEQENLQFHVEKLL